MRKSALALVVTVLVYLGSVSTAWPQQNDVLSLQTLLNNAGFNVGQADGSWGPKTRAGLSALSDAAGLALDVPSGKPADEEASALLAAARAWKAASEATFTTQSLPSGFHWGANSEWFRNITNWSVGAVVEANGKEQHFTVPRHGQLIATDLEQFRAVGISVVRLHINFEGMVLGHSCYWGFDPGYPAANDCFEAEYAKASKASWKPQTEALDDFRSNPGIELYLDALKQLTDAGFHVMVSPNDFHWGNGNDWTDSDIPPLLHAYLDKDAGLREFFARWVGKLVSAIRDEGITNFSFQALNEPRWCNNVGKWKGIERSIFDAARRVAPTLQLVSSAACTAIDEEVGFGDFSYYRALNAKMPLHDELTNVVYSIHMRLPRMLSIGGDHFPLKPGTRIPYPYEPMPVSAGLTHVARVQIERYNEIEPDRQFFADAFDEIGRFARDKGVQVIVTEWGASKPDYGLSREDRLEFFKDYADAAKANGVMILYDSFFSQTGWAVAPHRSDMPDHRFDPAIMSEIARNNGAPDYDPATADIGDRLPEIEAALKPVFDHVAAAVEALRPKFDFSKHAVATSYDGAICKFEIRREENGRPLGRLVQGRFTVDAGKLKIDPLITWDHGLRAPNTPDPMQIADLAVTQQAQLIGMIDLFVSFSQDGEFYPARQFTLDPARGSFDREKLTGQVRFPIDNVMTAVVDVTYCKLPASN